MIIGIADCGVRYAVRRAGSAVGYCALSIGCGTRDEAGFHSGIAHFTEHTIFKGTSRKSAAVINSYLDRLGGELNAYTTKEEIVLHATVLKEDLPKAASLLLELGIMPTFPPREIETERGVVIDEIISYKDSPADDIYDCFEELFFKGHPLSGQILGSEESVGEITSEELRRFVREKFLPSRMAFTLVADIDETQMERSVWQLLSEYFPSANAAPPIAASSNADLDTAVPPVDDSANAALGTAAPPIAVSPDAALVIARAQSARGNLPSPPSPSGVRDCRCSEYFAPTPSHFDIREDKSNHEANAVIGGLAPSHQMGRERIATVLLCNILGGPGSNSILNSQLREKHGWVYSVEASYTQYTDAGIMAVSLGCDKSNLEKCCMAVRKEILKLQTIPLSPRSLKAAKKQFLGQLAISSDNGESQALSMGKSLLTFGHIDSDESIRERIESITAEEIMQAARSIFAPEGTSRLIFL